MLNFEFITKTDDLIESIQLESNPFKVGEKIYMNVDVHSDWWNKTKTKMKKEFTIESIEHFITIEYLPNQKHHQKLTVSITLV
ncbi:hypothetical protein MEO93_20875 [Dolichospermum sp. ST_sed3]|nr:hypothetical protein [Dolichospermum sp. ST_sed3]